MPQQTDAIIKQLRAIAGQVESLNLQETSAISDVADRLNDLFSEQGDLMEWLESEDRFDRAVERVSSVLDKSGDADRRDIVESMRELRPVLRGLRAAKLRERFPNLSDHLIAAPASVLRESLKEKGRKP